MYILSFLRLDFNKIYLFKGIFVYKGVDFVVIELFFVRINNVIVICVIVFIVVYVDFVFFVIVFVFLILGNFFFFFCIVYLK